MSGLEELGEWGVTANRAVFSLVGSGNVLKIVVVMVAQCCEYTQKNVELCTLRGKSVRTVKCPLGTVRSP